MLLNCDCDRACIESKNFYVADNCKKNTIDATTIIIVINQNMLWTAI